MKLAKSYKKRNKKQGNEIRPLSPLDIGERQFGTRPKAIAVTFGDNCNGWHHAQKQLPAAAWIGVRK